MNLHFELKKGTRKGTMVFLHGNSSSSKVFNETFSSSIDHTLIRMDLPGHGGSPKNPQSYAIDTLRTMVIDFIIEKVTEPFLLIGNSLGGHLAIEILPELPQCKGLVIFGTPPLKKPINAEEAFLPCEALNTYFKADYTDFWYENVVNSVGTTGLVQVSKAMADGLNYLLKEDKYKNILEYWS